MLFNLPLSAIGDGDGQLQRAGALVVRLTQSIGGNAVSFDDDAAVAGEFGVTDAGLRILVSVPRLSPTLIQRDLARLHKLLSGCVWFSAIMGGG